MLGLAYAKSGEKNGFIAHLLLRGNYSFYDEQPSFGDGHGNGIDVVLGGHIGRLKILSRFGTENHELPRRGNGGWFDAPTGVPLQHDMRFFHLMIGYQF